MTADQFGDRLKGYTQSSDIHGLKYFVGSNLWRKLFWAIMIILCIVTTVWLTRASFRAYFNYEYESDINITFGGVPLPTIVICTGSDNSIQPRSLKANDIVNAFSRRFGLVNLNNKTMATDSDGLRYFKQQTIDTFRQLLDSENKTVMEEAAKELFEKKYRKDVVDALYAKADDSLKANNWKKLVEILADHGTKKPIYPKTTYNKEDVIKRAARTFNNLNNINCNFMGESQIFTPMPCNGTWKMTANAGVCITIPTEHFQAGVVAADIRIGFGMRGDSLIMFPWRFTARELELYLEGPDESYNDAQTRKQVANIAFGQATSVVVGRMVDVWRLGPPYKHECGNKMYDEEVRYTVSTCVDHCVGDTQESTLGCKNSHLGGGGVDCTPSHANYTNSIFRGRGGGKNQYRELVKQGGCREKCPDACKERIYVSDSTVSFKFREDDLAQVIVRTGDFTERQIIEERPKHTAITLMAELGGMCGLFIGISIVTIIHLVEFLLGEIIYVCTCGWRSKPKKRRAQKDGDNQQQSKKDTPDQGKNTNTQAENVPQKQTQPPPSRGQNSDGYGNHPLHGCTQSDGGGWMDESRGGQHSGQLNGQHNGQHNGQYNGQYNGQHNGQTNGQHNGQHNGQTNGQYNGQHNHRDAWYKDEGYYDDFPDEGYYRR